MSKWHFGPPAIPTAIVALSLIALLVPLLTVLLTGEAPLRFEALLWLVALVPAFVLAYYRGWHGVALGLAGGMAVFVVVQVYLVTTGSRLPDWPFMISVLAVFVGVALALGGVTERVHVERERAERLALYDVLTGLPNRRYFELLLDKEFAAARRGRPVMMVAFDLDHLKDINDRLGHAAGDRMLEAFAEVLARNTRSMDLSARLGGDEFMSLLSQSTAEGAAIFASRVRESAEALEGLPGPLRVSIGMAPFAPDMERPEQLVDAADRALYASKERRARSAPGSTPAAPARSGP
jgi:diguanylate cyclase (GGDEF)-like protein